jgi:hypothetical protein
LWSEPAISTQVPIGSAVDNNRAVIDSHNFRSNFGNFLLPLLLWGQRRAGLAKVESINDQVWL